MFLSQAIGRIKPSPTLVISARAKALMAQGIDIIDLRVGEPDIAPPAQVLEAAHQAIREGHNGYTAVDGTPSLKAAIAEKFKRDQGLVYTASEIVVTPGAKYLIFQALLATLNVGDDVVIPTPSWVSYGDIVAFTGATPVYVPAGPQAQFKLSPEGLRQALSAATKWLILNSPNNPTGAVYSADELRALGDVLKEFPHVWVLSDDIYEAFVYGDRAFETLVQVAPWLKDRVLMVNGISKAYAMTGWRIGYGAGPAPLMRAIAMLQSQSTTNPCAIAQKAAEAALLKAPGFADLRGLFQSRRDACLENLKKVPELSCAAPEGAFYAYLSCEALLNRITPEGEVLSTDTHVADYFLKAAHVSLVPGEAFGYSPYLRLSYALDPQRVQEAIHRLRQAIDRLRLP